MAFEKNWAGIPAQSFIADGSSQGEILLLSTDGFFVKMDVNVVSSTQPVLNLEVKRVLSPTLLVVGPKGSIELRSDLSAYHSADNASIGANQQRRPTIPIQELQRAVYQEEPAVALRTMDVDPHGDPTYGQMQLANPIIDAVYDAIGAAYPAVDTEVYTYCSGGLAGTLVATLTVTYTDATKNNVLSVVKS